MTAMAFDEVFDRLYFSATSEHDKGSKFEELLESYLQTEPKYADQFSKVWRWQHWPGRAGRVDTGIDLVAEDRYTGELVAIQAKFYDPERKLEKHHIDSFFTELGKEPFARGMIVSSTDQWSSHAEAALAGQTKEVQRIRLRDFAESTIDWSVFDLDRPHELQAKPGKQPRKYQREAIDDVIDGFTKHDRGKLIMACGTGKTFTALSLVEHYVPAGGSVLFLVPSIALLQQTLNEWTGQANVSLRPFAVCSDTSVGRKQSEDVSVHDLGFPATTDPSKLAARFNISTGDESISVVFSTYQSIDVIHQAQQMGTQRGEAGLPGMAAFEKGLPDFDLIICDEAHRTTGISQPGADDSAFVRVHNDEFIHAKKRLYMTATPRIYVEDSKAKAAQDGVAVYSMDDESTYGPELHHLGFGRAVELGHLSDYKVLILAVDEASVATSFQRLLSEDGDLNLDDVARIVGCWNGLSKRGVHGQRLAINDDSPMNRAVAFARNIKESKALADQFEKIGRELLVNRTDDQSKLRMEAEHVDGTFNVLERSKRLDWLQEEAGANTCRILTNAKCLTEGVDVPSLDGVLFLNPRNSQVDVVQAVGRVMRKAPGKEYGYIVLPIAVPADQDPETALNDNKKYKVVWDVLQALRAHDDRFEAMINKIDLDKGANKTVDVIGVGNGDDEDAGSDRSSGQDSAEALFSMVNAAAWENAIFARMVKKVGDRRYWEDWAADVKDIADRQTARLLSIINDPENTTVEDRFSEFVSALRANLNDGITDTDAVDMLVQHMITKPVFDALFDDYDFTAHNPVSKVMDTMLAVLGEYNLDTETGKLDEFYRSVGVRAEGIESAQGKQKIITELYERFFKLAFPKTAESLGIVYTPIEVVDFILRSVNDVLKEHFGTTISGEGVHVLDPFTGTGTFITRLLQSGLIEPADLARKYANELHANEILLMAYYIAAINIEATFHGLQREAALESGTDPDQVGYKPFEGIVLTDTFQMTENGDTLDEAMFIGNNDRVIAQNGLDIRVILGNPPYSVGQSSGNDNNANQKYPTLDESIRSTYAARSSATLKNSLYDSYVRAIRWASNRVLDSDNGGVVCYVSNGGYIDGNTADGLRKTVTDEFHDVYIFNLRGNTRTSGEHARREGGQVFGPGSRATVAVMVLVKRPGGVDRCVLHYKDIGDYLDRATKLATLGENTLSTLDWDTVVPNEYGDWINQRDPNYENYPLIADKKDTSGRTIFSLQSGGLKTNRDAWVYNSSMKKVASNVEAMVDFYNSEVERWRQGTGEGSVEAFINTDPMKFSWDRADRQRLPRGEVYKVQADAQRVSAYRPFQKQHVHFDRKLNNTVYRLNELFPTAATINTGFYNVGAGSAVPFSVLMLDAIPDLHVTGAGSGGQFFARYSYSAPVEDSLLETPTKRDNITDWALSEYRKTYGHDVSKDDIFFYVYGLLHSTDYRTTYEAELKKTLPRIPQVKGRENFDEFVRAGRKLSAMHIGYETVDPYPLTETVATVVPEDDYEFFAVSKMKYGGKSGAWDKTVIKYNQYITIEGIPEDAQRYLLGSRSGLDWILERYQVKTDKASGIVNDPNDWSREHNQPRYIIDLIRKITTVSLETMRIVDALPRLDTN
ncbi:DEAD/DEAH box helicase [Brevibacterium casei]|uniref:DEAD/DEAH box helicase n=1 Tax=Brevibacterium casei TaxID=33889 RepID=UPI0021B08783|nr:type ISP restriction/modification enzyme [Brevibacterium casei]MCT1551790.1 DEAD/DEAH box helicase family protein [Brevibacterium casei]MCT1561356.1 DEAD/DEAH box helicase family protein [Brevibacterium casei]MCT2209554.1 DEAD/DEAH box helicase family protein [Brevibacterium casei]